MQLHQLPTGTIDLRFHNDTLYLQFNCSCADALPYCGALCCRGRPDVNVALKPGEKEKYQHHNYDDNLTVLQWDGERCTYLDEQNLCKIHEEKPQTCQTWHCSPEGVGEEITERQVGWKLSSDGFNFV
jgi:Fe-S-cluster containining protein